MGEYVIIQDVAVPAAARIVRDERGDNLVFDSYCDADNWIKRPENYCTGSSYAVVDLGNLMTVAMP